MNSTAKSDFGPRRLPVQWLDAPVVGPFVICRRHARRVPGTPRCVVGTPRCGVRTPQRGAPAFVVRGLRAFTLLELMMVVAIIGFIAALTLPHVAGIGQANSMTTATRQLLDDVALARQRAMVNRSTVYMVFLPPMFWTNRPYLNPPPGYEIPSGMQVSNLLTHQYSGYALVSLATVGDQPGQHHPRYLTDWRSLPTGVFIAPFEFSLTNNAGTNLYIYTTNTLTSVVFTNLIPPWTWTPAPGVPFPSIYPPNTVMSLPCIGFTPLGSLTTPFVNQYIVLARGSIFYPTDTNGVPLYQPPDVLENPPGNDVKNPNLIQIDWMTGRSTLLQNQLQ